MMTHSWSHRSLAENSCCLRSSLLSTWMIHAGAKVGRPRELETRWRRTVQGNSVQIKSRRTGETNLSLLYDRWGHRLNSQTTKGKSVGKPVDGLGYLIALGERLQHLFRMLFGGDLGCGRVRR